jgi:hypothetical protein
MPELDAYREAREHRHAWEPRGCPDDLPLRAETAAWLHSQDLDFYEACSCGAVRRPPALTWS